jgi:hypothetical protein
MIRKAFISMIFGCYLIGCLGCAAVSGRRDAINPSLLEPQALSKFNDVPVPVGFKLMSQDSYCFEASGVRMGLLKYHGKANADLIVNFYREQMAMYSWNLLNVIEYGQRLMNFDRETETCTVSISPKGSAVDITIAVGPKAQPVVRKSKPVVK